MKTRLEQKYTDGLERAGRQGRGRVLRGIRSHRSTLPPGVPGRELLRFSGTIPEEMLARMERVIEEEFEQIDHADW